MRLVDLTGGVSLMGVLARKHWRGYDVRYNPDMPVEQVESMLFNVDDLLSTLCPPPVRTIELYDAGYVLLHLERCTRIYKLERETP